MIHHREGVMMSTLLYCGVIQLVSDDRTRTCEAYKQQIYIP